MKKLLPLALGALLVLCFALSPTIAQTIPGGGGGGGAGCTLANPTGTAGPTAVNGSATTCPRSDSAPAVQKASNAQFGIMEGDTSTISCTAGVCSAVGGGSGTVTSITGGNGILCNPTTITTTGSCADTNTLNTQTSTSYAIASTDGGKTVSQSNASSIADTIVAASTTGFTSGFMTTIANIGAGTITLTPATSTINGAATLVIVQNETCDIWSDSTNYWAACGNGAPGSPTGSAGGDLGSTYPNPTVTNGSHITNSSIPNSGLVNPAITIGGQSTALGASTTNQGNGAKLQLSTGSTTTNDCVKYDANGNAVDAGAGCGSGSGGGGMFNYSDNGVTVTAATYYAPIGGGGAPQSTLANVSIPSPSATTVTNLSVSISGTLGGLSTGFTVTLYVAGSPSALTCNFNPSSATACTDTAHSVNVTQGQTLAWQIITAGTITGTPTITISANNGTSNVGVTTLTAGTNISLSSGATCTSTCTINDLGTFDFSNSGTNVATASTKYLGMSSQGQGPAATDATASSPISKARTFGVIAGVTGSGFYCEQGTAPSSGQTTVYTLRVNGASPSSGPVCTITAGNTTGSDTTHSATATAGQLIDVQVVNSSTSATGPLGDSITVQ